MRRPTLVFAALVTIALQTACSSSGSHRETDRTPRTLGTYLTDRQRDERDINAAIQGWHRDYGAAKATPGKPHPELAKWASPKVVDAYTKRLQRYSADRQAAKPAPHPKSTVEIVALEPRGDASYTVTTCEIDDKWLIDTTSGRVLDDGVGIYRAVLITTRQPDGRWAITDVVRQARVGSAAVGTWEALCRQ